MRNVTVQISVSEINIKRTHRRWQWGWGVGTGWGCSMMGYWGKYLGISVRKWQETGENYTLRGFIICTPHQTLFGWSKKDEISWRVRRKRIVHGTYVRKPEGKRSLEDTGLDGRNILEWNLKEELHGCTELVWSTWERAVESCNAGR
jgi:hypothetical protein